MWIDAFPSPTPRLLLPGGRRRTLEELTGDTGRVETFHVARAAVWHSMHRMGLRSGERVLVPSYHCGVEVEAVRQAGPEIDFYRIDERMAPDLEDLSRRIVPSTRAILTIHYFGYPQPMNAIQEICRTRGLRLLEDCAHVSMSRFDGKQLGTFGDYAVWSLPKHLPVPDGGVLRGGPEDVGREPLRPPHRLVVARQIAISLARRIRATHSGSYAVLDRTLIRAARLGLGLLRRGGVQDPLTRLDPGASAFEPGIVAYDISPASRRVLAHLSIAEIAARRADHSRRLLERIRGWGDRYLCFHSVGEDVSPMVFPIRVADREGVIERLRVRGVGCFIFGGRLHPLLPREDFPEAVELSRSVLGLPVHQDLNGRAIDHVADALRACLDGEAAPAGRRHGGGRG